MDHDAVIVGAGLSGLSLAAQLAAGPWADRRVLIVNDQHHDIRSRAWAYWTSNPGWLSSAATGAWNAIAVHAAGSFRLMPLHPYRYVSISGDALADVLHARLSMCPHFELVSGNVESVRDMREHALVRLDGRDVSASWAFDSRPLGSDQAWPRLVFLGWEVEVDCDSFDPDVATFMDFRGRPAGRVSFCYVLPTTARHALVEIAEFQWHESAPDLESSLAEYLRNVCGLVSWTATRTEAGVLPLARPRVAGPNGRVVPIGVRGGRLKSSTGFALERIQRQSAAIAASLSRHGHPHGIPPHTRRHAWLDGIFLDVIRSDPDLVEEVLGRLFARNGAPAVLRFLDEDSSIAQEARLIATLPVLPFLRAAVFAGGSSHPRRQLGDGDQ